MVTLHFFNDRPPLAIYASAEEPPQLTIPVELPARKIDAYCRGIGFVRPLSKITRCRCLSPSIRSPAISLA